MFRLAIVFLVVAMIAAVFGFGGIAHQATDFARIIFFVALVFAIVGFVIGGRGSRAIMLVGALTLPAAMGVMHRSQNNANVSLAA
jgi:uncharacterized membrane protein YtjA (UPF0391 family)